MKAFPSNIVVLLVIISQGVWLGFTVNQQKIDIEMSTDNTRCMYSNSVISLISDIV